MVIQGAPARKTIAGYILEVKNEKINPWRINDAISFQEDT